MGIDMGLATIIGAGVSAAASGGSAAAAGKMNKRGRRDAKEARKWQSEESAMQRAWQEQMTEKSLRYQAAFDAYNYEKYNSPTARMAALKEAGLNPDLMYGSASGGNAVVPTGSPSSPSGSTPGSPSMPDYSAGTAMAMEAIQGIKGAASGYLDNELKRSQINNVEADTKVKDKSVQLMDSTIDLQSIQGDYTKEQKRLIGAQISNLDAQIKHLNQAIEESKANVALKNVSKEIQQQQLSEMKQTFQERFNAIIFGNRKLLKELEINDQELQFLRRSLEDRLTILASDAGIASDEREVSAAQLALSKGIYGRKDKDGNMKFSTGFQMFYEMSMELLEGNAGSTQRMLELLNSYGDAQAIIGMTTSVMSSLAQVIQSVRKGMPAGFEEEFQESSPRGSTFSRRRRTVLH
ncbi:DNA pilot protein [Dipodfec virus UOA04_Rod_391]|nr:DNA pilot protein [Dipodfec virus UOA04_Rod_391]